MVHARYSQVIAGNTHTPITTTNRNSTHTPSAQQRQQQLQNLPDYGRRRHERRRRRLSRGAGVAKLTPTTLHCAYSEGGAAGHTLHNSNSKPRRAAHETKHNMHCKESKNPERAPAWHAHSHHHKQTARHWHLGASDSNTRAGARLTQTAGTEAVQVCQCTYTPLRPQAFTTTWAWL